ncbi:MAG: SAM-dependent methyltransferase [Verrucomicrobia bacterium]|nr:SAM-dependent methyltransferase [Verrucomicrobiota bacterium]
MNSEFQVSLPSRCFASVAAGFKSQVSPTPLLQVILQEISAVGGALPFRRFMELALYHPEHGYYASGHARIGKEGDFFTSISVGRIYGRLLASVCREVWERLDRPEAFTIVEQGANDGRMAADILGAIREVEEQDDDFSRAASYLIVEPFGINQRRQKEKLRAFPHIGWVSSNDDLPVFTGIHLSNELLDAFPVDSLRWDGCAWEEECVGNNEGSLSWKTRPVTDSALAEAVRLLPANLPAGFRVEVNPGMKPWLETLHAKLKRGLILTVDYGQAGDDRYAHHRADGTLLAYRNHERFNDPLPDPGQRDISAQVDFTTLARSARDVGFGILAYSDQHHFLVGAAEPWLRSLGDFTEKSDAAKSDLRALQALLNPGSMGMQFKAIALGKDFPAEPPLGCFNYARPGIGVL